MSAHISNVRPKPDQVLVDIADYVTKYKVKSAQAYETARYCLIDTLGCGFEALEYPACTKLLGPIVPGTIVPNGAKVPGTPYQLDPVMAAFNIGTMIRWLDFNDTWLAAEWGHPSDNLGGILATADWLSRNAVAAGKKPLTVKDVLTAMIKAHEIQGCIALENSFNKVGLDHVVLVKVASTAVVGGDARASRSDEIINAVSLAWVDGQSLRTYRHTPNTGSRKSWAAGDATSRAVRLALIAKTGEMGYPSVLTAKTWGFYDVLFKGNAFKFQRPYGSYVMENVLFKISFPAEFHSQTAVEAAMTLHKELAKARQDAGGHREDHHPHARGLHPHHRQEGAARTTRPTATTASSTWWPCRCSSAASRPATTRTRSRTTRASTSCATGSSASRTRSSRRTTTTRTSARSPTRSPWSSTTARS